MIQQHLLGGTGSLFSGVRIGSDPNNSIDLELVERVDRRGHEYQRQSLLHAGGDRHGGRRGAVDFLVYRIDFGTQAGNASPDKLRVWLNPTPGVLPSDASANASVTLPTGVYLNFTDSNVQIYGASYYNMTNIDELRLGTTYGGVALVALPLVPATLGAGGRQWHRFPPLHGHFQQ